MSKKATVVKRGNGTVETEPKRKYVARPLYQMPFKTALAGIDRSILPVFKG